MAGQIPGDDPVIGVQVGLVMGTEDATPLEFWVAVSPDQYLQLDDVVALQRQVPGHADRVQMFGVVTQVRARHEGARFDSDVFLAAEGVLPSEVWEAAKVQTTRFEPEVFVPPRPGTPVRRAAGDERDAALFFDQMDTRLPIGLSRDDEPLFANLEFVDGTRGAHVNISGVSGVATKTSYATFLLYSLFHSPALGEDRLNSKALIFNVKGEDLLFLDHPNTSLDDRQRLRWQRMGLDAGAFASLSVHAPPRVGAASAAPDVKTRAEGVTSFFWTLEEFCSEDLLPFLFADAEDERRQYPIVVASVAAKLREARGIGDGAVNLDGVSCRTFRQLVDVIVDRLEEDDSRWEWAGRSIGQGTIAAFIRRLVAAVPYVERLIRGDVANPARHRIDFDKQVTVVDLHNLNDRAKRFVVGVVLRRAFDRKERSGSARPLQFVVLDELNKYAPREGTSPIKEILLDVAERGRSLGIILIGAQQTASEVERRIIANSAIRVVGRLDAAEASRDEYGFLPTVQRQRSTILKPGTMLVAQPELPVPLVVEFPFPSWATRPSEAGTNPLATAHPGDPFEGLV